MLTADRLRVVRDKPGPGGVLIDVEPDGAEMGEIVMRGNNVMKGYYNDTAGTTQAFAGGWFHSGDLVRVDDEGFVYVVDRVKDMIISGGENIYCAEVENAIAGHERIREVAVIEGGRVPLEFTATEFAAVVERFVQA